MIVDGDGKNVITVQTVLDSVALADDEVNAESYSRDFHQVGTAAPFEDHTLLTIAVDADGVSHSAEAKWTDTV